MEDESAFAKEDSAARKTVRQLFAGLTWVARVFLGLGILAVGIGAPALLWQVLPAVPCAEAGEHLSWINDLNGPGCRSILGANYATWREFMSSFPGIVTAVVTTVATTLLTTVVQQVMPNFD